MFKIYISGYLFVFFIITSCKSSDQQTEIPVCIQSKIESLKKEPVQNPPAEVWEWVSDTQTYYYFTSPCCDQFNFLYNKSCEKICAPDGGFTGKGDQKCPEYIKDMTKTLVWKDVSKG